MSDRKGFEVSDSAVECWVKHGDREDLPNAEREVVEMIESLDSRVLGSRALDFPGAAEFWVEVIPAGVIANAPGVRVGMEWGDIGVRLQMSLETARQLGALIVAATSRAPGDGTEG
jgi:hypothetical protein